MTDARREECPNATPARLLRADLLRIDALCDRFEQAWRSGQEPTIEQVLGDEPEPVRAVLLRHLLTIELEYLSQAGRSPEPAAYCHRFPEHTGLVQDVFGLVVGRLDAGATTASAAGQASGPVDGEVPDFRGRSFGRYQVLSLIGRGGFAAVYMAYDSQLARTVALKIPRPDLQQKPEAIERFLREGRAAAQLRHPHIVGIHDMGEVGDTYYLVSDLVAGSTLREHLQTGWHLGRREAVELVAKLAEALDYAHKKGVVHRDIKPANVMLDTDGEPQIMDFGLARWEQEESMTSQHDVLLGTPAYMSPEQAKGAGHLADGRSDLWSLGVVFYELLTGQRPFAGTGMKVTKAILETDPRPPRAFDRSIPEDLEAICLKCLAKAPELRYSTCRELAEDLQRWLRGDPPRVRATGFLRRHWPWW